jgi:hypothetical protein
MAWEGENMTDSGRTVFGGGGDLYTGFGSFIVGVPGNVTIPADSYGDIPFSVVASEADWATINEDGQVTLDPGTYFLTASGTLWHPNFTDPIVAFVGLSGAPNQNPLSLAVTNAALAADQGGPAYSFHLAATVLRAEGDTGLLSVYIQSPTDVLTASSNLAITKVGE